MVEREQGERGEREQGRAVAPHKAQGPKQRFRVQGDAEGVPFPIVEVDATDEDNAKDQWRATNGAAHDAVELNVYRVPAPAVQRPR